MDKQDLQDDRRSDYQFHQAQIITYLKATGIEVGLLINFGNPKLETKRFTRHR